MSRNGTKSQKRITGLRSTRTKARTHVDRLRAANADLKKKLAEALEQQTATSEVLRVISSSPGDLQPVFQAMLENATRVCGSNFGTLYLREGDAFRAVSMHGATPTYMQSRLGQLLYPGPETGIGRMVRTKDVVHIPDATADPAYRQGDPMRVAAVDLGGVRTLLDVPMLKENELIGAIAIYREEVRPFTDKDIELVKNFASQAVIAIEIPASSTSCANRCSSRPPPPTCSRSSAAQLSICRRFSIRSSKVQPSCAMPTTR